MIRHPGIVAAQSAAVRPTITRQYFGAEGLGVITGSDASTWWNLATLTFTPDSGADYLVIWTCELNGDLTTFNGTVARIAEGGTTIDQVIHVPTLTADTAAWALQGGFYKHTSGGSPVPLTLTLDIKRHDDSSLPMTPKGRQARIIVLRLEADDQWAENTAPQTTFSNTPVDGLSLNFTPGTAGDYLVLGLGMVAGGTVSERPSMRLYDGTVGTPDQVYEVRGLHGFMSAVHPWVKTGVSGAQTWKLQYWDKSNFGVTLSGARIVALRMDGFSHVFRSELNAMNAGGETGYTDALTLSRDVQAKDFLAIGVWNEGRSGANTNLFGAQFVDDAGSINENLETVGPQDAANVNPGFSVRLAAYSAARRTWHIQRKSPGFANAQIVTPGLIALLQLN